MRTLAASLLLSLPAARGQADRDQVPRRYRGNLLFSTSSPRATVNATSWVRVGQWLM
jgi:hypothetical protein